jgi:hypothetical protein
MSPAPLFTVVCASLVAVACAAAQPGYQPTQSGGLLDRAKPFEAGVMGADGGYVPSKAERDLECGKLTGSMRIIITRLKDAGNRPQPSAATQILSNTTTAVTGRPQHMDMSAELQRERARLVAYNRLLAEKKCPTLDLAKELPA